MTSALSLVLRNLIRALFIAVQQIAVIQDGRQVSSLPVNFEPSCASMNGHHPDVVVGGTTDHKVRFWLAG